MKGIKLPELTAERLAELAGLHLPPPPPPKPTFVKPDPEHLTPEQALTALRMAHKQLTSTTSVMNNKAIASRYIAPVIKYLEDVSVD